MSIPRNIIKVLKLVCKCVRKTVFANYRLLSIDILIIDAGIAYNGK